MDFCADAFRVFAVASAMSVRLPAEALCRWQVVQSAVLGLYGVLRVNANEQTVVLATAADVFATLLRLVLIGRSFFAASLFGSVFLLQSCHAQHEEPCFRCSHL